MIKNLRISSLSSKICCSAKEQTSAILSRVPFTLFHTCSLSSCISPPVASFQCNVLYFCTQYWLLVQIYWFKSTRLDISCLISVTSQSIESERKLCGNGNANGCGGNIVIDEIIDWQTVILLEIQKSPPKMLFDFACDFLGFSRFVLFCFVQ